MGIILNVLITGGAGFVGSHLIERFISKQYNVTDKVNQISVNYLCIISKWKRKVLLYLEFSMLNNKI